MSVQGFIKKKDPKRINDALTKRVSADYECYLVLMNHQDTLLSALDLVLKQGGLDAESHHFITTNIRKVLSNRSEANDEFIHALIG